MGRRSLRTKALVLLSSGLLLLGGCGGPQDGSPAGSGPEPMLEVARRILTQAADAPAQLIGRSAASAPDAEAETTRVYYRFVDENGSIRFVEHLDLVPPDQRDGARIEWETRARRASQRGTVASGPKIRRSAPAAAATHAAASRAQPEVVVYTTSWCGWCRKTLAHLDRRGVDYLNKDIEADPAAAAELRRKTGSTAIPVTEIDGTLVRGFDRERIDQLLEGS